MGKLEIRTSQCVLCGMPPFHVLVSHRGRTQQGNIQNICDVHLNWRDELSFVEPLIFGIAGWDELRRWDNYLSFSYKCFALILPLTFFPKYYQVAPVPSRVADNYLCLSRAIFWNFCAVSIQHVNFLRKLAWQHNTDISNIINP